jgi:thiol-disulfide isomerase/thioredoxin
MRRRDLLILGGVGVLAAAAGALLGPILSQSQAGAEDLGSATYPDLSGVPRRISELNARVLVCNFWATWCEPCREEVPLLIKIREKYAHKSVEVVGIGIDRAAKMRQFATEFQVPYPLLVADPRATELMRKLGNDAGALPFTVVRDRAGRIGYRHLGLLKEPALAGAIEAMLR